MATKKAKAKKISAKAATKPDLGLQPLADAISEVASEVRSLDSLADRVSDLSFNLGWLARSHTLAAIVEFGNAEEKEHALERLKRMMEQS
jgi:hypothetical protein